MKITTNSIVIRTLQELVAALNRRMPRAQHAGEAAIARDAAVLKATALARIAELQGGPASEGGVR